MATSVIDQLVADQRLRELDAELRWLVVQLLSSSPVALLGEDRDALLASGVVRKKRGGGYIVDLAPIPGTPVVLPQSEGDTSSKEIKANACSFDESPHQQFIGWFDAFYREALALKHVWGSREAKAVKDMLAAVGSDLAKQAVRNWDERRRVEGYWAGSGLPIVTIAMRLNEILAWKPRGPDRRQIDFTEHRSPGVDKTAERFKQLDEHKALVAAQKVKIKPPPMGGWPGDE